KAVTKLEDAKGLRLRTHGGLSNVVTAALGAAPATIPTAEVYTALERGVVDGAMRALPSLVDFNESEVLKNIVTPNLFMGNAMILVNQDRWKKVPANLQKVLSDAVAENLRWADDYYENLEKKSREILIKKGVKFNALSKSELARWRKALDRPQRDWYSKQAGPEGKALLSILDKYEKM
ncbi:MAG: TRAP transporter substrate-binding protein DctP, partial [bacterium]|nr:TRAP transporter substrate-binding protein DctP [bacterium]